MITTKNNEHKKLNVPNLRFPEFQEEWEEYRIEDITVNISSGRCKSHSSNGKYNLYGSTGIIGKTDEACYEGNLVLVARVGANAGFLQIINEPCGITDNTLIIKPKEVDVQYIYYFLQHFNLNRLIFGSGQPLITGGMLKKVKVSLGTIQEQNKITRLLSVLDERITTQNKIIEDLKKLKSAISKKLLCNDKWTTYKIQDIAEIGRGRVISSVEIDRQKHPLYPVYSSQTSNNGIMGYLDNYMFDGEYITWTTDGANAGTVFYRKGKFNCTNVCGTLKILPKFDCYFVSLVLQQATQKYVSSNLANPKLMNNTMASIKIRMPNIETQKQLSKVFQTLDSCLLVHQRTCKMYLSEKQYLLRQMFI